MIDKKVLVTGGAGYIGSHVCLALRSAGYTPVIFDNLSTGHRFLANGYELIIGDLNNKKKLNDIFLNNNILGVLHFAGSAYVGESVDHPKKYYQNNLINTINLLDCCVKHQIQNFIFSSTCATYGAPNIEFINEMQEQNPINPYGRTKLAIEWVLKDYKRAYQLKPIILRYFNVAGADENGDIGECHYPETHLIPLIFDAISGISNPLTIFGNDYKTHDGTCIRDYIHVSDLSNAHVLAFQYLMSGGKPDCFNVGIGKGYSVLEIINSVIKVTGAKPKIVDGKRRVGDPERLVSDTKKIRSALGWEPDYTKIDDIIQTAWNWYKLNNMCKI
jgi:UDP-glucose 4-epimerase